MGNHPSVRRAMRGASLGATVGPLLFVVGGVLWLVADAVEHPSALAGIGWQGAAAGLFVWSAYWLFIGLLAGAPTGAVVGLILGLLWPRRVA